jgi:DNA-binding protein H-NS
MAATMSNLIDIQSQIDKLTKQASEIKAREFDKTVQEIVAKMNAFGISLKNLQQALGGTRRQVKGRASKVKAGSSAGRKPSAKTKSKFAGTVVAAKFRGPNGESWSGRGLMPRWLSALVAQGQTKEDFAVKS